VSDAVATALADRLREAIVLLSERATEDAALERARGLADELCRELAGPRRPRWYEDESSAHEPSSESRNAYVVQSPVRGRLNPIAPPLVMESPITREDGRPAVVARARLSSAYEGPPHGVHGGWVAALFDDLLGGTQALVSRTGVTAKLTVRYRQITPLDEDLRFEGWIHADQGRRITARATCHAGGVLTADAEAVFVRVDFDEIANRMRSRREPR
jgi:acyl-coenzyme A thioesterase PaaI-like protein